MEPVIGLEIHVRLATATKLFCGDVAAFGAEPNTHVCPVCIGLPGALPVTNGRAVELAVRAALGLGCTVHKISAFARKQYFYPDLPKGYQITQYDRPLATDGSLVVGAGPAGGEGGEGEIGSGDRVRIQRVHLEEDAGKSIHDRIAGCTAIDLNRAGVPLIEIVTAPDLGSATCARRFLAGLKRLLEYLEVSDCDMEKGSLRVDANISMRPVGSRSLGIRTEIKNLNSFANVERALRFEEARQGRLLAEGRAVVPQTLLWDAVAGEARVARSKVETPDYRYFPDPDLPTLELSGALLDRVHNDLPELPDARMQRLVVEYGLPAYDARVLTSSRAVADYYEAVAAEAGDAKAASNWVMTVVMAWLNQHSATVRELPLSPSRLAELVGLVGVGAVSMKTGRYVFSRMIETGRPAAAIIEAEDLGRVADGARIDVWIDEELEEHKEEAQRLQGGEEKLLDFFMGRVIQRSGGRADPRRVAALLRSRLLG